MNTNGIIPVSGETRVMLSMVCGWNSTLFFFFLKRDCCGKESLVMVNSNDQDGHMEQLIHACLMSFKGKALKNTFLFKAA